MKRLLDEVRISQMSHDQIVGVCNRLHTVGSRGLTKRQQLKACLLRLKYLRQLKAPEVILKNVQKLLIRYRYTPTGRRTRLD